MADQAVNRVKEGFKSAKNKRENAAESVDTKKLAKQDIPHSLPAKGNSGQLSSAPMTLDGFKKIPVGKLPDFRLDA